MECVIAYLTKSEAEALAQVIGANSYYQGHPEFSLDRSTKIAKRLGSAMFLVAKLSLETEALVEKLEEVGSKDAMRTASKIRKVAL
jgi:hypothetical protein